MIFSGIILLLIGIFSLPSNASEDLGPSPDAEFLQQPENMTIPEGQVAILKCKVVKPAQRCRWFYLEKGLDFFDGRANPVIVKDFQPNNPLDCTIKFKKVHDLQEGQWLCLALDHRRRTYSRPAFLDVITEEEAIRKEEELAMRERELELKRQEEEREEKEKRLRFLTSEDDHVQNTYEKAEQVLLDCSVSQPLSSCSWVMPHNNVLHYTQFETNNTSHKQHYGMEGSLSEGNCSLTIKNVRMQDEGNWRCVVQVSEDGSDDTDDLMGPLIHLHLIEYSHIRGDDPNDHGVFYNNENAFIYTIVASTLFLLIIIVILFYFLHIRKRATKDEKQSIIPPTSVSSDNYSHKWLQKVNMKSEDNLQHMKSKEIPIQYTDVNYHNQYLDMNGRSTMQDGYIVMPGNILNNSSPSTASTLPMDRSRTLSSVTTTSTLSCESNNSPVGRQVRPFSIYSAQHLYEEITEHKEPPKIPVYSNLTEDQEGYMIPNRQSGEHSIGAKAKYSIKTIERVKQKELPKIPTQEDHIVAPAYCQVGEPNQTLVVNKEYGMKSEKEKQRISTDSPIESNNENHYINDSKNTNYDVPKGSTESLVTNRHPLENYDVPRPTSTTATVTKENHPAKVEVAIGGIPGTIV